MSIRSRSILKTWFEKGDKPTQAQFADLIDSIFNLQDDSYLLSKILDYSSTKIYSQYDIVIYNGVLRVCQVSGSTGSFQPDNWSTIPNYITRYSSVTSVWSPSTSYTVDQWVIYNSLLYRVILNHTSGTLNAPPNSTYWQRLNTTDSTTKTWESLAYLENDTVVYNNSLYKCTATKLNSFDFVSELTAGEWVPISNPRAWSSGTQYLIGDWVYVGTGTNIYRCTISHTSSGSFNSSNWQSYGASANTIYTSKFNAANSIGPWVFTISAPYPTSIIGVFLNGRLTNSSDYTITGSNLNIITWVSSTFGLETGDEIQIKYI